MSLDSSALIFKDLSCVTKEPIKVSGKGFMQEYTAKSGVRINDSFFLKDSCDICGRCCVPEENVWTETTIQPFFIDAERHTEDYIVEEIDFPFEMKIPLVEEFKKSIEQREVIVNGKEKKLWVSVCDDESPIVTFHGTPERKPMKRCRWLNSGEDHTIGVHWDKCKIHPYRSVTCRIPHMRIKESADRKYGILGVQSYGRNWQLGCPVHFDEVIDENDILSKISTLKILEQYAQDLGIETYLPDIIRYLEKGGRKACLIEKSSSLGLL